MSIAALLTSLRDSLRRGSRDKRDRLATYLDQIAKALRDAREDLARGGHAFDQCSQLRTFLGLIPPEVEELLGRERALELGEHIRRAQRTRFMVSEGGLAATSEGGLDAIAEAAGMFTALAAYLRVTD